MRLKIILYTFLFLLCATLTYGQILRDINYSYRYNPALQFSFRWEITNLNGKTEVHYLLEPSTESKNISAFTLEWELRNDLSDKEGKPLPFKLKSFPDKKIGTLSIDSASAGQIVLAKIYEKMPNNTLQLTLFYKVIPAETSPVLFTTGQPVMRTYSQVNKPVQVRGFEPGAPLTLSYYKSEFPAAAPAFSTALAKVPATLKPDSIFTASENALLFLQQKGLYLVQRDTASSKGLAFRIEDDYPKLNKLENLAGPMIYICTNQEYQRLLAAGSDKTQFDKIILSITGTPERARIFMRNYFRRVEQANVLFSSYKEGWKTDRGMIYIIFGPPEEVFLVGNREVWEYKNVYYKGRFTFVKSSTMFDPENFVLIRDKDYSDKWYSMIDLWRKARF